MPNNVETVETPVEEIILEDQLLDHLATEEGAKSLYALKFSEEWVNDKDQEIKNVLNFVFKQIRESGKPPTKEVLAYEFPIEFCDPICEADWLVIQFRVRYKRNEASKVTKRVARLIASDPEEAVNVAVSEFTRVQSESADASGVVSSKDWQYNVDLYKEKVQQGFHVGVTMGWPEVDKVLGGLRKGGLYYIIARPKVGKTWFLLRSAVEACKNGNKVVFFSLEMTLEEIMGRYMCMLAGVSYGRYHKGKMTHEDLQKMKDAHNKHNDKSNGEIVFLDPPIGERTVQALAQVAKEHGADAVIVDQLKFLKTTRASSSTPRHQEIEYINEELKDAADDFPWYIACQYNRDAEKMDEMADLTKIGLSDSIGQTADILLGIYQSKGMRENGIVQFGVIESRSSESARWEMQNNVGAVSNFKLLNKVVQ